MTEDELNHLKLLETHNKLLIKHNLDLMKQNLLLTNKHDECQEAYLRNRNNRRQKNKTN